MPGTVGVGGGAVDSALQWRCAQRLRGVRTLPLAASAAAVAPRASVARHTASLVRSAEHHSPAYLTISQYIFIRATNPRSRPSFSSLVRCVMLSSGTTWTVMPFFLR
jgi:hypothetical protein